jgi:hypothetical protein
MPCPLVITHGIHRLPSFLSVLGGGERWVYAHETDLLSRLAAPVPVHASWNRWRVYPENVLSYGFANFYTSLVHFLIASFRRMLFANFFAPLSGCIFLENALLIGFTNFCVTLSGRHFSGKCSSLLRQFCYIFLVYFLVYIFLSSLIASWTALPSLFSAKTLSFTWLRVEDEQDTLVNLYAVCCAVAVCCAGFVLCAALSSSSTLRLPRMLDATGCSLGCGVCGAAFFRAYSPSWPCLRSSPKKKTEEKLPDFCTLTLTADPRDCPRDQNPALQQQRGCLGTPDRYQHYREAKFVSLKVLILRSLQCAFFLFVFVILSGRLNQMM